MKVLTLEIDGFRGMQHAKLVFPDHSVLIGPNGSGKSTIVDAMSLVFGRTRLVRDLTEHDFHGSCPTATSRIRIVATVGGFRTNDTDHHDSWFREGRAVPKWWNLATQSVEPEESGDASELCAQLGLAARFDLEELAVEIIRYFHDDDSIDDVFLEDDVVQVPYRLLDDFGYYVLPARRTWESAVSFASELFRKAVATIGGIPAETILDERDRLRKPSQALEEDGRLKPLVERLNDQLAQLLPTSPRFQLRVTATDSDSLLRALIPHYETDEGFGLPVGRHGTGLLSLQTFILLLELGRERQRQGRPFMLAIEEPELHVPPGVHHRLLSEAVSIAEQTICTSHSPRVAAFYPATAVQLLERRIESPVDNEEGGGNLAEAKQGDGGDAVEVEKEGLAVLASSPLLEAPLSGDASNAMRKLYHDDRARLIDAVMHHRVLIPEGRSDHEWLRLLTSALETSQRAQRAGPADAPPFSAVVGVVPTHDGAVAEVYTSLRRVRSGLVPLVDGDNAGDDKASELIAITPPPDILIQWGHGWTVEDVTGWILKAAEAAALEDLRNRIEREFDSIDELVELFKVGTGAGRLKTDYLAYQDVTSVIGMHEPCLERAEELLGTLTLACLGRHAECELVNVDEDRSTADFSMLRFCP